MRSQANELEIIKNALGRVRNKREERVAICWRTFYCFCWWFLSIALYIFLAPGDNHTPLYMRQRVETRSKRKEKTSVALLLLVSPSTRGDSPPPPHRALLYSQWCWLQFSLIPLLHLVFFLYSSSRRERDAHCLCTRTQCPRGPFTIQYKLLGADAATALLLLPNCHYLIRRKRKLYDGGSSQ